MDLLVDSDYQKGQRPPHVADLAPCIVTVSLILVSSTQKGRLPQTVLVLDATAQEEACSYAQVHVALLHPEGSDKPIVCGIRQTGTGSLPMSLLPDCVGLAVSALEKVPRAYKHAESPALLSELYTLQ
jgi:exosome complex RNA-binding protein Rrp42 (RNase PH superfamily)